MLYRCYQLMELLRCGTFGELCDRIKSSYQFTGWLAYLDIRDAREQERLQKMFGDQ